MKHKFWLGLLTSAALVTAAFGLAACSGGGETGGGGGSGTGGNGGTGGGEHVHNYGELIPEQPSTCAQEGLQAHYYCSGCQTYFDSEKTETTLDNLKIGMKDHIYGELIPERSATCRAEGLQAHYQCAECKKYFNGEKVETAYDDLKIGVDSNAHKWGADGKCEYCQTPKPVYTMSEDNTKIYFGEYPQSEVTETGLKGMLGMEAGELPSASNANGWTDYNYYVGDAIQSYMWYKDVEYQNGRFRGVYFTSYRPEQTKDRISESVFGNNSRQDDNGYLVNTLYWFRYEPIEWRILEQKDGTALLMSNIILDSQQFYHSQNNRTENGTVYANNYKESDIREWLNSTFYETAFDELARSIIQITEVKNDASTTFSPDDNPRVCDDTSDRIFLLSYSDVINPEYGFDSDGTANDEARKLDRTAYALAQGYNTSTSSGEDGWWLRSPRHNHDFTALIVRNSGIAAGSSWCEYQGVIYTSEGIVPALRIKL